MTHYNNSFTYLLTFTYLVSKFMFTQQSLQSKFYKGALLVFYKIDKRIFNCLDALLADLSIEISM